MYIINSHFKGKLGVKCRLTSYNSSLRITSRMSNKQNASKILIIQGITEDGRKFRPSDWAERMSGMLSSFGDDHRIHYSPQLRPISVDGVKSIAIDTDLSNTQPQTYNQIMEFAKRNMLRIIDAPTQPEK